MLEFPDLDRTPVLKPHPTIDRLGHGQDKSPIPDLAEERSF